jgi:NADPH:quinone reductase-like Zn-dependent oxidoreductase
LTALNVSLNSGDDIAGVVHALGSDVAKTKEFVVGDRVAAFHPMMSAHGAFAEYAVAPYHTVFKIPDETSFEGKLRGILTLSKDSYACRRFPKFLRR